MSDTKISLFDFETLKNPYEAYRSLRDTQPVHFEAALNVHVVTRYDLVRQVIKDTKTFSSRFDKFLAASQEMMFAGASREIQGQLIELAGKMTETPPTMLTLDEPDHTRYRSLVNKLFTASQIKLSQPAVQAVVDDCIEDLSASNGRDDFIANFANPVPLRIIADRLGIPESGREFFEKAATYAASALRITPMSGEMLVERAQTALDLQKFLVEIVEARRSHPEEDMITILANSKLTDEHGEERLLTHGECISVLNQFLVAGHETTSSAFGWGMLLLCQNPELQEQLRGNEKLVKVFVEEALRLEAPVQGLPRLVTQDTDLDGYPLKGGDLIMIRYGAANRDERQFENPDVVDIHRAKAGSQLAFGAGVHFCIGAPLARQELNLGFLSLLDRFEKFAIDTSAPAPGSEASFILRNLPQLMITYTPRS